MMAILFPGSKSQKSGRKNWRKKRQQEIEEMDKQSQQTYDEKDLAGLKVDHDLDGLVEGEEQILTLKDSRILDNEGRAT